jgi:hypothetical protein
MGAERAVRLMAVRWVLSSELFIITHQSSLRFVVGGIFMN